MEINLTTYVIGAFVFGAVWLSVVTLIAERVGSRLGGVIVGLPSTIFISYLFIALSQSSEIIYEVSESGPLFMVYS